MIYPLVKEMAAVGAPVRVPVAVACRVLGFSKQGYYKWLKQPVSAREAEERELIAVVLAGAGGLVAQHRRGDAPGRRGMRQSTRAAPGGTALVRVVRVWVRRPVPAPAPR